MLALTGHQLTPAQILESERQYPGLWDDLNTVNWQRALIEETLKGQQR